MVKCRPFDRPGSARSSRIATANPELTNELKDKISASNSVRLYGVDPLAATFEFLSRELEQLRRPSCLERPKPRTSQGGRGKRDPDTHHEATSASGVRAPAGKLGALKAPARPLHASPDLETEPAATLACSASRAFARFPKRSRRAVLEEVAVMS
jgi:hypothetical protein